MDIWPFRSLNEAAGRGAVIGFKGPNRWMSNFWEADVVMYGVTFPTNEHAFVAAKHVLAGSREGMAHLRHIAQIAHPGQVKKIGRNVPLRPDWCDKREDGLETRQWVLLTLARRKFQSHPDLAAKLLATKDRLILEGNTWGDMTWGVIDTKAGVKGKNWMGNILMQVRDELRGA